MSNEQIKQAILQGKTALGIELGSTRIKAVLVDQSHESIASGSFEWENKLENGIWTYSLEDAWAGMQGCFADLKRDVVDRYGVKFTTTAAIGVSAMMHGYLPFDKDDNLLVPFRTWRNTITEQAAAELTELFSFSIPQRWSIAHLHQAILNQEEHVKEIAFVTTLAGYIHWQLTGRKVLGVGDASGMFPIDSVTGQYDAGRVKKFDEKLKDGGLSITIGEVFPQVLSAGADAGTLTAQGAKLLDPEGDLAAGIPLCPPEGDAGTGMVATNAVAPKTGNISAGTSVFAMIVLEKALKKLHVEIDMVTTPTGMPVAMVHASNCTSDLNAWVSLFGEFAKTMGMEIDANTLFGTLYNKALEGDKDCAGLLSYNYYSGEHLTHLTQGRPLFARMPDAKFNLANFMRTHLYAALATLKMGMDILLVDEKVTIDQIYGHGGLFKTKGVGQRIMAAAIRTPVSVMETAGEGGAWGIALLAAYSAFAPEGELLETYLNDRVFAGMAGETIAPDEADAVGFDEYTKMYEAGLAIERAAVETMK